MSRLGMLLKTFVQPSAALAAAAQARSIVLPLLVSTTLSVGLAAVAIPRLDMDRAASLRVANEIVQGTMTPAKWDRQVAIAKSSEVQAAYVASAVTPVLEALCIAALLWLGLRLARGKPGFRSTLAISAHALLPLALKKVLSIAAVLPRSKLPVEAIDRLIPSNPGFFLAADARGAVPAVLGALDVFSAWCLVLLVIGLAPVAQVTRQRAAVVTVVLWAAYVGLFKIALVSRFLAGG